MAYATVDDVQKRFKNLKFLSQADLTANNLCGEVTREQVECFIEEAEASINLHLCNCYCTPLEASDGSGVLPVTITALLRRWTVILASFDVAGVMNVRAGFNTKNNSTDYHNQDTAEYKAYKQVVKELEGIRSGKMRLCGLKPCTESNSDPIAMGGDADLSNLGGNCCASECYDIDPCIKYNTNF